VEVLVRELNREAFVRASLFLKTQARPLDRTLFEYRFEGGPSDAVQAELVHFHNEDGGFGKALEPDFRTPSSSALATALGLSVLKEIGSAADHPVIRAAVEFLLATYNERTLTWRVVPEDTNLFPDAPWWHDEGGSLSQTFDGFRIIPRVLIVGLLHHYRSLVPADWLERLTEDVVQVVETVDVLGGGGGSDLEYATSLAPTQALPEHYRKRVATRVLEAIPAAVVRDHADWDSYCITPLKAVPSPRSLGADLISEELKGTPRL